MKRLLLFIINLYQNTPTSTHGMCRHIPTCSNYAKESIEKYGAFKGSILGLKRILKCNPLGTKGYDPVPSKEELK